MPELSQKSLIVSLHDAHPGSHAAIAEQITFLAGYGITCSSLLVVPEFHHGINVAGDSAFCHDLTKWRAAGHEIVLHGYYHDRREAPRENLRTLFWTRLYTSQEAEFLDLPLNEARVRLEKGRALLTALGLSPNGFVAPAWLMADGLTHLLRELGFAYTTRLREIIPLRGAHDNAAPTAIASQSLCYSARAGWRRLASAAWNKQLFARIRATSLVRLSLHPRDLEFPLVRRQVDQILRATLKQGFEPATYADYVAR